MRYYYGVGLGQLVFGVCVCGRGEDGGGGCEWVVSGRGKGGVRVV